MVALLIRTTTAVREWADDDFHWQRSGCFLPPPPRFRPRTHPLSPSTLVVAQQTPPREPTGDHTPIIRAPAWTRAFRRLARARVCTAILPTDMRLLLCGALLLPTFDAEASLLSC